MQVVGLADLLSYIAAAVASLGNATANVMQRKAGLARAAGSKLSRQELAAVGLMTVGMIALIGAPAPRSGNEETVEPVGAHGVLGLVSTWPTYAAVTTGLGGVRIMQWALPSGPSVATQLASDEYGARSQRPLVGELEA
jgi:hypothetical protein